MIVVATGLLGACGGQPSPYGSPDPGGRIMAAVSTVQRAVPAQARIVRSQHVKPSWDSCDGRAGTFGWNDVAVVVTFTTPVPARTLLAATTARLLSAGWSPYQGKDGRYQPGPRSAWWSRPVPGGTALALLSRDGTRGGLPQWDLSAHAPPFSGPRASGC